MTEHLLKDTVFYGEVSSAYGRFFLNLFNGQINAKGLEGGKRIGQISEFEAQCEIGENPSTRYLIITLN